MNDQVNASEILSQYISLEGITDFLDWRAFLFLIVAVVIIWVAKLVNDWLTPYKINHELTKADNKAVAVSFSGYLLAVVIVLYGVFTDPAPEALETNTSLTSENLVTLLYDVAQTFGWGLIGILLLNIARGLNDKLILRRFDNVKEIIQDKNVGTAAVEFGSYVGTAFVVKAVVFGQVTHWVESVLATVVFFIVSQGAFILFGVIYQRITSYDIHEEIEKDNVAAGIAFGMNLAAMGIILSLAVEATSSLIIVALWFVQGALLLVITRFIVDKLILPFDRLSDEIANDKNWGAALIEGVGAISVAFLVIATFV